MHVLYGYDSSVVEQALRSASSVLCQMVCQVVWVDLDSAVCMAQPNTKITKWLQASNKRAMKQLLMNNPKNEAELKTSYQTNPDGEVSGVRTTVKNTVPCCCTVSKRPACCQA